MFSPVLQHPISTVHSHSSAYSFEAIYKKASHQSKSLVIRVKPPLTLSLSLSFTPSGQVPY